MVAASAPAADRIAASIAMPAKPAVVIPARPAEALPLVFIATSSRFRNVSLAFEEGEDRTEALLRRLSGSVDDELGLLGRLVRRRDAGELGDLAGACLLVEALRIALLALVELALGVDLDEAAFGHRLARDLAIGAIRRDERRDVDDACIRKQRGHFADAANVFGAIGGREAEILVEAVADVVAIEHEAAHAALPQCLFHEVCDRGLARSGKPGQPHGKAAVAVDGFALVAGNGRLVPNNVLRFRFRHGLS